MSNNTHNPKPPPATIFHPPINTNGRKSKLMPWILGNLPEGAFENFYDPFLGSGCVLFNAVTNTNGKFQKFIGGDTNRHIINLYEFIKSVDIGELQNFFEKQNEKLKSGGEDHYYRIRDEFNTTFEPKLFLFLNRTCFNGLIRFNSKGGFNSAFCRDPERIDGQSLMKIVAMCSRVAALMRKNEVALFNQDFSKMISNTTQKDFIYADPPYFSLETNYGGFGWSEQDETRLFEILNATKSKFMMSNWGLSGDKTNPMVEKFWKKFNVVEIEHKYGIAGNAESRNKRVVELLVTNY